MTSSNGNIFRVTGHLCGEFTAQRPVTRSFDVFFDMRLNKKLSKQSWGWWFETLSSPLWRHRNAPQEVVWYLLCVLILPGDTSQESPWFYQYQFCIFTHSGLVRSNGTKDTMPNPVRWRYQMETFSVLPILCEGNQPAGTDGFPSQSPVTQSFGVFYDLCLNKRLSKQLSRRWFETPLRSLWCHCNGYDYGSDGDFQAVQP